MEAFAHFQENPRKGEKKIVQKTLDLCFTCQQRGAIIIRKVGGKGASE